MRTAALLAVLALAAVSGFAAASAPAASGPRPAGLVASLPLSGLPWSGGAVRGREVILARGFEADLGRALAGRLRLRVSFVHAPTRGWGVSFGRLAPAGSLSYLRADHVVVASPGSTRPRSLSDLAARTLCAQRGTRAEDGLARLRPAGRLRAASREELARLLRTGRCEAALVDPGAVAALGARPVARVPSTFAYSLAVAPGVPRGDVERALGRLAADGTLRRLARTWFGVDLARLPLLS